jgi:hypothetical protein
MLYVPNHGMSELENAYTGTTSAEIGATVTANAATAHTVGAWAQLDAATTYDAYGVTVSISALGTAASTNTRSLVNIAIGAAASEQTIIPNLICGQAGSWNSGSIGPVMYHFPIRIPQGTRIAANLQSLALSDTATVNVWLHQFQVPGKWYGQRVTAYGPNTATSSGVSHTHGNNAYATTTQITASTTNPIKYLQVGTDLLTDTTGGTKRGMFRIAAGSSTNYVLSGVPYRESTTLETTDFLHSNFLLSHMAFSIPAASYLGVGAMMNATGEARGWAFYGVD